MGFNIGPTIKVDGEKEYNDAMKKIRQNLSYVTAEMKKVTSEFNTNERSMESLTQQNNVLRKAEEEQARAVEESKAAMKRLTDAGVEPTADAYRKLKASLDYAEAALNDTRREIRLNEEAIEDAKASTQDFSKEQDENVKSSEKQKKGLSALADIFGINIPDGMLDSIGGLNKLDDKLGETAGKSKDEFGKVVGAMGGIDAASLRVIAAVAAIGAEFVKMRVEAELELDALSAKLKVSLGLTDEEAKDAEKSIERIYMAYGGSREEAEQALAATMRLMGATGDEAESLAKQLMVINDAWGEDYASTARTASTLIKEFGITGQEALDIIAAGLQTTANKNGDLLDVLNEYAPSFSRLGDDVDAFLSRIVAATDAGAYSADKAADVYKEFFNKAADGGADFKAALESLGFNSESTIKILLSGGDRAQAKVDAIMERLGNMGDITKQNQIASGLLGSQWEDVGTKAVVAMANVSSAMVDATGKSTKAMEDMMDTASTKMDNVWKVLKKQALEIFPIYTVISKPIDWAKSSIDEIKKNMSIWMKQLQDDGDVPAYASGTSYHPGGLALIGEHGPEYAMLPRGTAVMPHRQSMAMAGGGDTYYNITIPASDIKEFNDIVRIAQRERITTRAGVARR